MKKKWLLGLLALCMSVATVIFVGCVNDGDGGGSTAAPIAGKILQYLVKEATP